MPNRSSWFAAWREQAGLEVPRRGSRHAEAHRRKALQRQ